MLDLDHTGSLREVANDAAPEPVLTLPSNVVHDELMPKDILKKNFLPYLPPDPNDKLIMVSKVIT